MNLKIKSRLYNIAALIFIMTCSCITKGADLTCIDVHNDAVCLVQYLDEDDDRAYQLRVNEQSYPRISFYNNAELKKLDQHQFEVFTNFSERGNVDITTSLSLEKGKPFIHRIYSRTRINEAPYGVIEYCTVMVNQYFSQDIGVYVERYLFDAPELEKNRNCVKVMLEVKEK